jgi:capping protein (actin filament) muscle Z-line, alpha
MMVPLPVTVAMLVPIPVALKLSISTQDLRRKLPVTRTLFPWHNTLVFGLTRDLAKELALGK